MVDTLDGIKFGAVKFVGSTALASGEWVGVALEQPSGRFIVEFGYYMLFLPYQEKMMKLKKV